MCRINVELLTFITFLHFHIFKGVMLLLRVKLSQSLVSGLTKILKTIFLKICWKEMFVCVCVLTLLKDVIVKCEDLLRLCTTLTPMSIHGF